MPRSIRRPGLVLMIGSAGLSFLISQAVASAPVDVDQLILVDCLLPGQLRKLGGKMTYLGARQAARLPASECEKRGGEYVAYDRATYATSLKVWLPLAQDGDPKAQVYVGEIYEKGLGSGPDFTQAALWYGKAASQGDPKGLLHSAYLYEQGLGVPKDPLKAVDLYRKAAGLKDDQLTFASNVDKAREEAQVTIDALMAKLEEGESKAQSQMSSLEETRRKLAAAESSVERLRRDDAELRKRVKVLQSAPPTAAKPAELEKLQAALADKEKALAASSQELDTIQHASVQENEALRARLAQSEKDQLLLQRQLGDSQSQAAKARADFEGAQARQAALQNETAKLQAQIKTGESNLRSLAEQLQTEKTGHGGESQRVTALQSQIAQQQVALDRQQLVASTLETQRQTLATQVQELQSSVEALRDKAGTGKAADAATINELRAALAGVRADLLRKTQLQNDLATQLAAAARQLSADSMALNTDAAALGAKSQEIKKVNAKLAEREALVVDLRTQIATLEASTKSDHQQLLAFDQKITELGTVRGAPPVGSTVVSVADAHSKEFGLGQSLALIIGNSKYEHMPKLETAEKDSDDVEAMLSQRYGFKGHVKTLHSAKRAEMITALYDIVRAAGDQDSLIIYYAGHGALDETTHRSYWLPVESSSDNPSNWISDSDITSWVSETKAKHVLIVADSCYAGAMTRTSVARLVSNGSSAAEKKRLLLLAKLPSRTVLTSGGVSPVLDGGPDGNSIFAHEFIELLGRNTQVLEITALYNVLAENVRLASLKVGELTGKKISQFPQIAWLQDAGHQSGGEFLFVPDVRQVASR